MRPRLLSRLAAVDDGGRSPRATQTRSDTACRPSHPLRRHPEIRNRPRHRCPCQAIPGTSISQSCRKASTYPLPSANARADSMHEPAQRHPVVSAPRRNGAAASTWFADAPQTGTDKTAKRSSRFLPCRAAIPGRAVSAGDRGRAASEHGCRRASRGTGRRGVA